MQRYLKIICKKRDFVLMYREALKNEKLFRATVTNIQSKGHLVKTVRQRKIALSAFDSKRYLLNCGVHSIPYGSFKIKKFGGKCQKCME